MRTTEIQIFKKIASKKFTLKDVEFIGFNDIGRADITSSIQVTNSTSDKSTVVFDADMFDIVCELKLKFSGDAPQSYRVLNSMIMDWVDDNEDSIKKIINPKLIPFLNKEYPDIDTSDLEEDFDDYIWEEQVDYHPEIDEENNEIHFTLELVLNVEEGDS